MSDDRMIDKSGWGDGPWQSEPDELRYTHDEAGYAVAIIRTKGGHLCGYVCVPSDHPAHGKGYYHSTFDCDEDGNETHKTLSPVEEDINAITVHGGLTFAVRGEHAWVGEAENGGWWFGFDCAHSGDVSPGYIKRWRELGLRDDDAQYRDMEYVKRECDSLAMQLRNIAARQYERDAIADALTGERGATT